MRRPFDSVAIRRILVIRDDRLGDALLAMPFLVALRRAFPRAEITVLASAANAEVFERNEAVAEVRLSSGGWRDLWTVARSIRAGGAPDLVFDLYSWTELRPVLLAWLTGASQRVGHDTHRRAFLHTIAVPLEAGIRYEPERSLDLLRGLGIPVEGGEGGHIPFFPLRDLDRAQARRAYTGIAVDPRAGYVVLHPGSGDRYRSFRRVSAEVLGQVARGLSERLGAVVLITGSRAEAGLADEVVRQAAVDSVRSVAARLTVGSLAALLADARLVVVPDTGVLHLAIAVNAPTVAVLGPVGEVNGPPRILPPDGRVHVARLDLGCVPEQCNIQRCRSVACLAGLDARLILGACERAAAAFQGQRAAAT